MNRVHTGIIVTICLILAGIVALSLMFKNQLKNLKQTQHTSAVENIRTNQFLMATISWSTQRQKTILFMRDQIINEWNRIGVTPNYDRAYLKAETIMKESERYPNIKPFVLLSVQKRESSFLDSTRDSTGAAIRMKSPVGALGAWQIMPSTARLLCEALGISYSERVFTDVGVSTRLAAKYFDILWATYENDTLSVADYNGGPWQARYYAEDKSKLAPETKGFVKDVMESMGRMESEFVTYRVEKAVLR